MPLHMIRGDITKIACDAIVNAANSTLLGGGGTDGAIHRAAGPELVAECRTLGGCAVGEAKLTKGYRLPADYVIHTVGPVWQGGNAGEAKQLAACYQNSLRLAAEHHLESIAFPLISSGTNGYPRREAQEIAVCEIARFLAKQDMTVYLVQYTRPEGQLFYPEIERWVSANSVRRPEPFAAFAMPNAAPAAAKEAKAKREHSFLGIHKRAVEADAMEECVAPAARQFPSLAERIRRKDESFSQMLLRKIDEAGMTDAECYKKANIDRKLFSKIRSDPHYQPKKVTALAFAIALELPLDETNAMLQAAGFAFSHSNTFDLIVEYFIRKGIYNVFTINEALYEYDQLLIGA